MKEAFISHSCSDALLGLNLEFVEIFPIMELFIRLEQQMKERVCRKKSH